MTADKPRCEPPEGWYVTEAMLEDAAEAMSAGWKAAPEGEGVMGAEMFAAECALRVLRDGKSAVDACADVFAGRGTYGRPFLHTLVRKTDYTPPHIVRGLVEALEGCVRLHSETDAVYEPGDAEDVRIKARAALKAAKEAGV